MGKTLAYKILENHLVEGTLAPGEAITIKIDQTLTQDSTGTMVYLQLEAMEVDKVKTELSVAYIDHNTLQTGFENADDHEFIKSVARRHGVLFSKPGNGICHQLQLENYGKPGKTLLGSDSHTPTGGGLGMIATTYGYNRYNDAVMLVAVVIIVILVQIFQSAGTRAAVRLDRRVGDKARRKAARKRKAEKAGLQ